MYVCMHACNDNENRGHEFEGEQRDVYEIGERKGRNYIIIFHNIKIKEIIKKILDLCFAWCSFSQISHMLICQDQ